MAEIKKAIQVNYVVDDIGEISDGYHTFNELYHQRLILSSALCLAHKDKCWKSLLHHDETMFDDYFIVGFDTPQGPYTYHYHVDDWFKFPCKILDRAPEWDGHTSKDVVRLLSLKNN